MALVTACVIAQAAGVPAPSDVPIQFVFTSDAHYGIARPFRGGARVSAQVVNRALVEQINSLGETRFPADGGLRAGQRVGWIDFIAQGGDIANREEDGGPGPVQPAAESWAEFQADYERGLTIKNRQGLRAPLFVVVGNHEASNAVGWYKPMTPAVDASAMVGIFNHMMHPPQPISVETFDYGRDRVHYSRNVGRIHFVFLQIWPDSSARAWMERDLASISGNTPTVIVTHDQPESEAKHFHNPNTPDSINPDDRFENLLVDTLRDGRTIDSPTTVEQAAFEEFLAHHPNVTAYFHGNSNWNEFYEWTGPAHRRSLHVFRVDSPMKGKYSADDERVLSFQVATLDPSSLQLTVRECLWNRGSPVVWGASTTVDLHPTSH